MRPLLSTRVLDQVRKPVHYIYYILQTGEAYVYSAKTFIRFHDLRHPAEIGKANIESYLMWRATTY
jgi:hypothetical protein